LSILNSGTNNAGSRKLCGCESDGVRIEVVVIDAGEECRIELDADVSAGRDGK
jgi:hypothetical protein